MSALNKLPALISRYRWRKILHQQVGFALVLAAGHAVFLAIVGNLSVRHPLSLELLRYLQASYAVYLLALVRFAVSCFDPQNRSERLAEELDKANPKAPDIFRTSLSLGNHDGETLSLLDALYTPHLASVAVPDRGLFTLFRAALLMVSTMVVLAGSLLSDNPREYLARVGSPWKRANEVPRVRIQLVSPPEVAGAGDSIFFNGRLENAVPKQIFFAHVHSGKDEKRFPINPSGKSLEFKFGPVTSDFTFHFSAANGRSRAASVRVLPRPHIEHIQVVLIPPMYTHLRPDTLPLAVTHFSVLPGTRAEWRIRASRVLESLVWENREQAADSELGEETLKIEFDSLGTGRNFRMEKELRFPLTYALHLKDMNGIRGQEPHHSRVDIRRDLYPEIAIVQPMDGYELGKEMKLPVSLMVRDDFGLTKLVLSYKITSGGLAKKVTDLDFSAWLKKSNAGIVMDEWDLGALELRPENLLEFHFTIFDNDTVSGPKFTRSEIRTLRMPSIQEVIASTRQKEQSALSSLKSAVQRQKQVDRKLERMNGGEREDSPPPISEYEINRIMVQDPSAQTRKSISLMEEMKTSKALSGRKPAWDKEIKELDRNLRESEKRLPQGNQARLELKERQKNLEDLMHSQGRELENIAQLREKLEKGPSVEQATRTQLEMLEKELRKNIQNQNDLHGLFKEEENRAQTEEKLTEQSLQEQQQVAEDVQAAMESMEEMMRQGTENDLLSSELLEKLKKVQELLSEVMPDSVKDMMQRKMEGQEVNAQDLREGMRRLMEKREELEQNLARALAMLEGMKDRRRLQEWEKSLGELADREKHLNSEIGKEKENDIPGQEREQQSIQEKTGKTLEEFASRAGEKKEWKELEERLRSEQVMKDMQDVRDALREKGKSNRSRAASSSASAKEKLGRMQSAMAEFLSAQGNSMDLDAAEVGELLQETLELANLQILIRNGRDRRAHDGWVSDEPGLYGSVSQVARWLNERIKELSGKLPMVGAPLLAESRKLTQAAQEAARNYHDETALESLRHNQNLARELLKLFKLAKDMESSGGGESGEGQSGGRSTSKSGGEGGLGEQLKGMSGKQMAVNQATQELLRAMLEGRRQRKGAGGDGSMQGIGNRQGSLGEELESMAESAGDEGGAAQKLRKLAEEARELESELRSGRISPENLRNKQERFQTKLLEAANALEERGYSDMREAETASGPMTPGPTVDKRGEPELFLRLLKEGRRKAGSLPMKEDQKKYLDKYYETLSTH